jgi:hypothetical protein
MNSSILKYGGLVEEALKFHVVPVGSGGYVHVSEHYH